MLGQEPLLQLAKTPGRKKNLYIHRSKAYKSSYAGVNVSLTRGFSGFLLPRLRCSWRFSSFDLEHVAAQRAAFLLRGTLRAARNGMRSMPATCRK